MSLHHHDSASEKSAVGDADIVTEVRREAALKTGALQDAIFNSANFSSIATDAQGIIQIFNVGAERMLGYTASEVLNKITPADISDPQEVIARAEALSVELVTPIAPGFEALVFKASRGIEDIYELTYIRKDGRRFPAVVSVTALRDAQGGIIGYLLIGTDNTARKHAEEALLKAGALQAAIFNSANFSSIATDAQGIIQIFNVGAERMLGYTASEVLNKITPADISDPQEVIARAEALSLELATPILPGFEALVFKASRGIEDIYELTYIRKDGSRFSAVVSVTALRDAQGGIIGYLLIGTDNTARKHAEEALLKAGALQAAIFNSANFSSIATDAQGIIQIFNVGAERMLGYTASEVLNKIPPADISDPQEVIARAKALSLELATPIAPGFEALVFKASRGIEDIYELTYVRKDGSRFSAVVSVTALRDDLGAVIGYLLIATDNTARKQAEAEQKRLDQLLLDQQRQVMEVDRRLKEQEFHSERLEKLVDERTAELLQANEKLRASEESNRLMLEGVHGHAIFRLDPAGNVASWNLGAERIKGYKAEEIIGQHFSRFYTPQETDNGVPQRELEIATTEGFFEQEGLRVRKDGSFFWAIATITPLYGHGPEPIGFVKVTRDITDRKKMREALRVSEDRFHLLVDGVKDHAILMLDPTGIILTWNSGAERINGYTAEEIVGQSYSCLFTPELIAQGKPAQELEQAAEGKTDVEGWRVRKDGSRFWVNGTLTALCDENGKVRGFAKITRDMTEKRRSDELLQSVLNHTLDGIITIDERGTISMMNRAGETLFGRTASEVIGQNINILMPEPYRGEHHSYLANYMRTGKAKIIGIGREVLGLRKDGSTFPLDLAVTEFQLDNQRYFVGIVRDVSERKKLESQLHQSQKMEAFGQLAGGVAHDFNNLLTVISGYSDLLLAKLPAGDPKTKMVDQVRRASERAAALTRQLLAFSRQQVLEPVVLDLNAVVTDIEKMLRRLIGEDVEFATVLGPAVSAVKVDPGQIEQVILNLAVNARDAMPQGGKLTIETCEAELDESYAKTHQDAKAGKFVMVAVSDTGCGMTPEVKARVFEPFFTTKGVGHGTGLGLAVVHGIVKQSGGNIDVYSEPGIGTTIRVYLPTAQLQPAASPSKGQEAASRGSETILLVEDEESVRDLATFVLQECGYKVMTAPEGLAALQLMATCREKIDLLVTDVVMTEMGGRKLAETLLPEHPELKVLFMSGYTDDAVVRHGVLQADTNFLQKPFTPNSLSKKVRDVLDQD